MITIHRPDPATDRRRRVRYGHWAAQNLGWIAITASIWITYFLTRCNER